MSTKLNPGAFDCHGAALPDEPMFVLLARDPLAPALVRQWGDETRKRLLSDPDFSAGLDVIEVSEKLGNELRKCSNADAIAHDMAVWRKLHDGAWRVPAQERAQVYADNPAHRDAVADAVLKSLCGMLVISTGQISQREHRINRWSMPGFAVWRHYFRFDAAEPHFERLMGLMTVELPEFNISGYDCELGDVLVRAKSPTDLRIELQLVGA